MMSNAETQVEQTTGLCQQIAHRFTDENSIFETPQAGESEPKQNFMITATFTNGKLMIGGNEITGLTVCDAHGGVRLIRDLGFHAAPLQEGDKIIIIKP
jgi:hypothetical protein